jgi:hypothetical protein
MKRFVLSMTVGALLLGPATVSFADQQILDRKENQQKRIGNGVKSGALTAGETAKLETKESKLNKEVRTDRKANGGNLTNNEKKQVNQQQNRLSNQIYDDKHNTKKQP